MKQKNEQITSKITYYRFRRPSMVNGTSNFWRIVSWDFPCLERCLRNSNFTPGKLMLYSGKTSSLVRVNYDELTLLVRSRNSMT